MKYIAYNNITIALNNNNNNVITIITLNNSNMDVNLLALRRFVNVGIQLKYETKKLQSTEAQCSGFNKKDPVTDDKSLK